MIRVLIVDDQVVICEGLKVVLNNHPAIQVVGTAHNGAQALEAVAAVQPTLVLMDLKMPVMNGVQATRTLAAQYPGLPVLVLTTYDDDEWVADAVQAGAAGYLLKDIASDELVAAVLGTAEGRAHIDPNVAGKLLAFVRQGTPPDKAFADAFTPRELEILRLLASGLTNIAIAQRLNLAEGTIRNHVTQIFEKLGVTDRAQATALAWRYGIARADTPRG